MTGPYLPHSGTDPNIISNYFYLTERHRREIGKLQATKSNWAKARGFTSASFIAARWGTVRRNPDRLLRLGTNGDCRRNYDE